MIVKRTAARAESPFARADLSRQIISQNKEKLMMAPVFLRDGLLSEIRDRQRRRRGNMRKWVSWTSALGFGAFLFVTSIRQSGLEVPLNTPVALDIPVPSVNGQKVASATVLLSEGMEFPSVSPGARLENHIKVVVDKPTLLVPVSSLHSGHHFVGVDFYRADGVLVASRVLDLKVEPNSKAPHSEPVAKVKEEARFGLRARKQAWLGLTPSTCFDSHFLGGLAAQG